MLALSEQTKAAIRAVPYFRESRYVDLDVSGTIDYFRRKFVESIPTKPLTAEHVVTDIGTGFGWLAMAAALHSPARVIAVDPDVARLKAAEAIAGLLGLEGRIEWRPGSVERLPVRDRESDVTFCIEVLEHTFGNPAGFKELDRVTGRYLIFTTPNAAFPVIAHDTQLPFCHWLPASLRDSYARLFRRGHKQHNNRFWTPWDISRQLPDFKRVSHFMHYRRVEDYFALYPYYLPYGRGGWRRRPSVESALYYRLVSRLGGLTPYLLPSLSATLERRHSDG